MTITLKLEAGNWNLQLWRSAAHTQVANNKKRTRLGILTFGDKQLCAQILVIDPVNLTSPHCIRPVPTPHDSGNTCGLRGVSKLCRTLDHHPLEAVRLFSGKEGDTKNFAPGAAFACALCLGRRWPFQERPSTTPTGMPQDFFLRRALRLQQ